MVSAESSKAPSASLSVLNDARRGSGSDPASFRTASPASGPLIRITAIAQGGVPLDTAKIVSVILFAPSARFSAQLDLSPSGFEEPGPR